MLPRPGAAHHDHHPTRTRHRPPPPTPRDLVPMGEDTHLGTPSQTASAPNQPRAPVSTTTHRLDTRPDRAHLRARAQPLVNCANDTWNPGTEPCTRTGASTWLLTHRPTVARTPHDDLPAPAQNAVHTHGRELVSRPDEPGNLTPPVCRRDPRKRSRPAGSRRRRVDDTGVATWSQTGSENAG